MRTEPVNSFLQMYQATAEAGQRSIYMQSNNPRQIKCADGSPLHNPPIKPSRSKRLAETGLLGLAVAVGLVAALVGLALGLGVAVVGVGGL